jgi:glucoamylase
LTGGRAHYELAAGRLAEAERLLVALESFSSDGKLIPEQVWDAADITERELFHGRPSGSAMPLAWAHAEHLKLLRSLADGRVFDMPPQPLERYQVAGIKSPYAAWRFNQKSRSLPRGQILRVEVGVATVVHWSLDGWGTVHDTPSRDSGFGIHFVDIPTAECTAGSAVVFTLFWPEAHRWEGTDYQTVVA